MGYPTSVQLIARKKTEQWYVNFPAAIARGMDFEKGEIVEWTIETRQRLTLRRTKRTEKSGRTSGGQPGHPGQTLRVSESPDHFMRHPLECCERSGGSLASVPCEDIEKRQVYDLPQPARTP